MINTNDRAGMSILVGLCACSGALLLTELLLTREFSAASGYHFAFMIISLAMFGITAGAIIAARLREDRLAQNLQLHCALFGISIPAAFGIVGLFNQLFAADQQIWSCLTFFVCCIPFYLSGVVICLCLTRFPNTGTLYCADLLGAAIACPLFFILLSNTDILNAFVVAGLLASGASFCFAKPDHKRLSAFSAVALCACLAFAFVLPRKIGGTNPNADVRWSPIAAVSIESGTSPAKTWTIVKEGPPVEQKLLNIDYRASTMMTAGNATPEQLEPIKNDLTAIANRLRPNSSLFILGVGGGRDVLTGLLFGQKQIDAVEVNPAMVKLLRDEFGDFSGHLDKRPGVHLVNDEARNWLESSRNQYDVIQSSLVDTWAASASGAFMLSENAIYTKDAFAQFVRHLKPGGIFSCLRWGNQSEPAQPMRMIGLAKYALAKNGITDAAPYLMLVSGPSDTMKHDVCDLLVSNKPFSKQDVEIVEEQCKLNKFTILYAPGAAAVEPFKTAVEKAEGIVEDLPSDDRPYFFTPSVFGKTAAYADAGADRAWHLLQLTLLQAFTLSIILVMPFMKPSFRQEVVSSKLLRASVVFAMVGLAFMLVEVAQMNRLTMVLGSPAYGVTVVLFVLLLSSAAGSQFAQTAVNRGKDPQRLLLIGLAIAGVTVFASGLLSQMLITSIGVLSLWPRIILSSICVAIPGFFMGWSVPMALSHYGDSQTRPWYWALNGAASVIGSVLAAIVAVSFGVTVTLTVGAAGYLLAAAVASIKSSSSVSTT